MKPLSTQLSIQKCTTSDAPLLTDISRDTFIAAFEAQNDPDDFKNYIETAFNETQLQNEINSDGTSFYFVYDSTELVGYFKVNIGKSQSDIKDENSMELERIYVLGGNQGKGIGAWILDQVIALAKNKALDYLWLGVWEHNPRAIKFYLDNGFTKFGTHPYFIGKDKQTDWLLRLEF